MRISKEQALRNRDSVVGIAAELFRERGFDGVSVAELMRGAGFTHGGFYNHFASKDALAASAVARAFRERSTELSQQGEASEMLRRYLSLAHRTSVRAGCPAAALGAETARQSDEVKRAFAAGVEGMVDDFEAGLAHKADISPEARRAMAIGLVAKCVGALMLSRAVPSSHRLADELISATLAGALVEIAAAGASGADPQAR